jgi:hypothetical protein
MLVSSDITLVFLSVYLVLELQIILI